MQALNAYYRWDGNTLILQLKVHAGARVAAWGKVLGGRIVVHVPAAPEKGRATARLLKFLANEFDVPALSVQLLGGAFSPQKLVQITNPGRLPVFLPPPPVPQ